MLEKIKYNIGDEVRTKIHYMNDPRSKVEAVICGVEIEDNTNRIKYKIHMEPTEEEKEEGCTGSTGYVYQDDILSS